MQVGIVSLISLLLTFSTAVLGGFYLLYSSLETRFGTLESEVKTVRENHANLTGKLEVMMPYLNKRVIEEISSEPAKFDISPWTEDNPYGADDGIQVFEASYLEALIDGPDFKFVGDFGSLSPEGDYLAVLCERGADQITAICSPASENIDPEYLHEIISGVFSERANVQSVD